MGLTEVGAADAGAFLSRLVRLNPGSLVRLTRAGPDHTALWARLPWEVLVTRRVAGTVRFGGGGGDRTVAAADLLARLTEPPDALPNRDALWRWPLPPSPGSVVETVPAEEIRRVGRAAASTLAEVAGAGLAGRRVGERAVRDALLAHVPIVVESGGVRVEVPQTLVQAVLRMGFVAASPPGAEARPGSGDDPVTVRLAGPWVGLAAGYGSAWQQRGGGLVLRPTR